MRSAILLLHLRHLGQNYQQAMRLMRCTWCRKRVWFWQIPNLQVWEMNGDRGEDIHEICLEVKTRRIRADRIDEIAFQCVEGEDDTIDSIIQDALGPHPLGQAQLDAMRRLAKEIILLRATCRSAGLHMETISHQVSEIISKSEVTERAAGTKT